MKVVLDTNVFVSGIFFTGPPYQILEAWRDDKLQLAISADILEEYHSVGLKLAEQFSAIDLGPVLDLVMANAEMFSVQCLPEAVCDDPDDDKFLACALACKSKVIVSGDKHLLRVSGFQGIQIIKPREFVNTYLSQ